MATFSWLAAMIVVARQLAFFNSMTVVFAVETVVGFALVGPVSNIYLPFC